MAAAVSNSIPLAIADLPEYLTPEEFQAVTRIGRTTTYDLIRRDKIPGVLRIGRAIRIPKDSINSFAVSR